jgi:ribose transport system permease protein
MANPTLQADLEVESRDVTDERSIPSPHRRYVKTPPLTTLAPWVIFVLLFIIYVALQPNVLQLASLGNIGITVLILAVVATGQTIVVLTAGIDLSVGGVMSFGGAIMATQMHTSSIAPWTVAVLAIGAAIGATNGVIITALRIQPFIVTLAMWSIVDGAALLVLPAAGGLVPIGFANFIYGDVGGFPTSLVLIAALLLVWLWLKRTRLLRRIYAIGSDEESAFLSGVPITSTKIAAYTLSGLFAMAAAVLYTMETSSGDPTSGDSFILTSVAAVVIGGTSLFGGRGGAGGTLAGALVLTLIADVMLAANISQFWTPIAQGALMIVAVVAGTIATQRARQREQAL